MSLQEQGETFDLDTIVSQDRTTQSDQLLKTNLQQREPDGELPSDYEAQLSGDDSGHGLSRLIDLYTDRVDATLDEWLKKIVEVCKPSLYIHSLQHL